MFISRRSRISSFLFAVFVGIGCSLRPPIPVRPDGLVKESIELNLAHPVRWRLRNGLEVFFLPDPEVPLVSGRLIVPAGSAFDPEELPGLAGAVASQIREGGIEGMSSEGLSRKLDSLAARIESAATTDYATVSFSALSEDLDEVLRLFAGVVRRPAFEPEKLTLWKQLTRDGISRRRDEPTTMAAMAFQDIIFGANTPLSHYPTLESVQRLDVGALRRFHRDLFRPNGAVLTLSGAVTSEIVRMATEREFGEWTPVRKPSPSPALVDSRPRSGVYVLERDFEQATILIGHRGPPRLTPDIYEMAIFNRHFGFSGFGSVLFNEVRSKRGLAYAVDGGLLPDYGAGIFEVSLGTRNDEAANAVAEVIRQIQLVTSEIPPLARIEEMKSAVKNGFVFNFETPAEIVGRASLLSYLRYPSDFDTTYLGRIEAVRPEDVRDVARRWIRPDELVVVVVGRVVPERLQQILELPVYTFSFDTAPRI